MVLVSSSFMSELFLTKPQHFTPQGSREECVGLCVCGVHVHACSPCGQQELTISTPQIGAHTISTLSLLSSHTPLTIHQLPITRVCAVKHTHTPFLFQDTYCSCVPCSHCCLVMNVCSLSAAQEGVFQRVCVPTAHNRYQSWTINCVCVLEEGVVVPPGSPLEPESQFSEHLKIALY